MQAHRVPCGSLRSALDDAAAHQALGGYPQGNDLFHSFVHKMEEELQAILLAKEARGCSWALRQDQQAHIVQCKWEQGEVHKKSLAGMKRVRAETHGDSDAKDLGAMPRPTGPTDLRSKMQLNIYSRQ
ncbi:suppressor of SWI4 1 homolog [Elephas maximus indicus]|uniref:suppressor of SWI4 1 homolog n=1 Tax=Elephas maximus indicus TaxID=99487 RepID=UPI000C813B06|nr:suppressor of SWI4 1 homolog [Loxodonta africana]XP_049744780.1 suppressor of SWI4 1 homolog [Elephas maximus indicus]